MTKAEIAEKVAEQIGCNKKDGAELVEAVFSIMKDQLVDGGSLKISGFGNFAVKRKADRLGRNPQTGEPLTIESRNVLSFKPSTILRHKVNHDS